MVERYEFEHSSWGKTEKSGITSRHKKIGWAGIYFIMIEIQKNIQIDFIKN